MKNSTFNVSVSGSKRTDGEMPECIVYTKLRRETRVYYRIRIV